MRYKYGVQFYNLVVLINGKDDGVVVAVVVGVVDASLIAMGEAEHIVGNVS